MIPHACSSWVAVDLGPHRALVPTAYCLLHGSQRRGNALRHWEFQVRVPSLDLYLGPYPAPIQPLSSPYLIDIGEFQVQSALEDGE